MGRRGEHLLHAEAAAHHDVVEVEAVAAQPRHVQRKADPPGGAQAHQAIELGRGVEPRLVGRDERDQAAAVRVAPLFDPGVATVEGLERLVREAGVVGRGARHDLPRQRLEGRLHRARRAVARGLEVVDQRARGAHRAVPEDRVRQEAVGLLRPQQRAQLVARGGRVEARRARRRASTSPMRTAPGTCPRRGSGSGSRRPRASCRRRGCARRRRGRGLRARAAARANATPARGEQAARREARS